MDSLEHSMTMTRTTAFDAALDVIDRLAPDDQEAMCRQGMHPQQSRSARTDN